MKKYILILLSVLAISCKKECKIISFSIGDGEPTNINFDEKAKNKILSQLTFDDQNRVVTKKYSYDSETYEIYFKYDSKNRLKQVIKQRYVLDQENISQLFLTETSTFIYNNLNITKIQAYVKINNFDVGIGKDTKSDYLIEYREKDEDVSKENFEILNKLSQSILPVKGGFLLQNYLGILPTKLIKSVVRKTDDTPSVKTTYNFKKDKENKVVEIEEVTEFDRDKNITKLYKINYDCK